MSNKLFFKGPKRLSFAIFSASELVYLGGAPYIIYCFALTFLLMILVPLHINLEVNILRMALIH